jgi:hypothetical protein
LVTAKIFTAKSHTNLIELAGPFWIVPGLLFESKGLIPTLLTPRPDRVICYNIDSKSYEWIDVTGLMLEDQARGIIIGNKEVCVLPGKRYVGRVAGGVS